MNWISKSALLCASFIISTISVLGQEESVARQWNEVNLNCIRKDFARPTVGARTLCHAAVVMYDAWAAFDDDADTYFLGKTWGAVECPYNGIQVPDDLEAAQNKCISYAMYRFLKARYSPSLVPPANYLTINGYIESKMAELGYNTAITSTDYSDGDPAKLGNYIASKVNQFATSDGANQLGNYANTYYQTANGNLFPALSGNPLQFDGNRWQPLGLDIVLDQNNNPLPTGAPALSAEWGNLVPFAMDDETDATVHIRDNFSWNVYHDPGPPVYLDTTVTDPVQWDEDFWRWGNIVVILWHSFHDVSDGVMKEISPSAIGNVDEASYPQTFEEFKAFYDEFNGGDPSVGYTVNPVTGLPYESQMVPRADYTRCLAEFWADGPSSETPPGHWFTIMNYVSDHPLVEKRWMGEGPLLSDLEWDVRSYLALGGAVHDAAISCWSAKGYYDFTRPVMAIRYMIDHGQCSNPELPNYDPAGIPLLPGYIELVQPGDPLAGASDENVNKVKLYTFRGPVAATGQDGVGWILGENWWTFQKHTFVTPPFPGYYSGHSTYSRAAAEVLTRITGSEYFPGGMGEFVAEQNQFLTASPGPSVDVTMQWAKYKDASDQCCLSRIYGGLHPPVDDIPGRRTGMIVGPEAFDFANGFMSQGIPHVINISPNAQIISDLLADDSFTVTFTFSENMDQSILPTIQLTGSDPVGTSLLPVSSAWTSANQFTLTYDVVDLDAVMSNVVFKISAATDLDGKVITPAFSIPVSIDTKNPEVLSVTANEPIISDANSGNASFALDFTFTEAMGTDFPEIVFTGQDLTSTLTLNESASSWTSNNVYHAVYDVNDSEVELSGITVDVTGSFDLAGNLQIDASNTGLFVVDTRNPQISSIVVNDNILDDSNVAADAVQVSIVFDEEMNATVNPSVSFPTENATGAGLSYNGGLSSWSDNTTFVAHFDLIDSNVELEAIDVLVATASDEAGNETNGGITADLFDIDTKNPEVTNIELNNTLIADIDNGAIFNVTLTFDDVMNQSTSPNISFTGEDPLVNSFDFVDSQWLSDQTFVASYLVSDANEELSDIGISVSNGVDNAGNDQNSAAQFDALFEIDTKNPEVTMLLANTYNITSSNATTGFSLVTVFDEPMNTNVNPVVSFPVENASGVLSYDAGNSAWLNNTTYTTAYAVPAIVPTLPDVDVNLNGAKDLAGNDLENIVYPDYFDINVIVNVADLDNQENIRIYPNPVQKGQDILVVTEVPLSGASIDLTDASGKLVQSISATQFNNGVLRIETNEMSAGTYYLRVLNATGETTYRVVIQN